VINFIKHKARSLIFSASMTPASVAAALKSLEIIEAEPERRIRLLDIAEKMHNGLRAMGYDTGISVTPVVPVLVGDQVKCFRFWKALFEAGVFANPVIPPAVEPGHALIRTSYMATHTDEQLERVLAIFQKVGRKLGIIPESRPTRPIPVQIARPGSFVISNQASARWAASPEVLNGSGFSVEQLMRFSTKEMANKLFDAMESITWRAANLQAADFERITRAPQKLWKSRGLIPGILLEKSASLLLKNGKHPES
jgi:hypothetical protein